MKLMLWDSTMMINVLSANIALPTIHELEYHDEED